MASNYDDADGVWRTIGGRRVFIRTGQSLSDAMIQSGKFTRVKRNEDLYKKLDEEKGTKKVDINSEEATNELMNADVGDWNNMNQAERDKTCEKILNDFEDKYGDKLKDEKFREEVLNGLEDQNFHTMGKIIEQKYEYSNDETLNDLDNRIAKATREEEIKAKQEAVNKSFEENQRKIQEEINNNQKNDTFTSQSTNPFYPDREYSKEDLKRMEENGVKPMDNTYSGSGWKGVNADKNLSTKEQAKAITDEMKKQYPDVKISRKSDVYSGGSSIDFNIMSSDKDLYVSDADIDKMDDFGRLSTGYGFENWAEKNVKGFKRYTNEVYTTDDVRKYAKESLSELKKRDNQSVKGDEWYLSDYGKKVVSELNKQANSYTYDDSDAMTDYFNHGTYMHVSIGKWNKPYEVNAKSKSMNDTLRNSAYQKYMKEHPNSKMTLNEFLKKK